MIDLFLPYVIGTMFGISTSPDDTAMSTTAEATTSIASRVPEDQTPTGAFTTATEVKPILSMTKPSWVAIGSSGGEDLLYFTQLLAWRCGIWEIRYGVNGAPPEQLLPMEPCHEGTATPNALTQVADFLPYVALAEGQIETVEVVVVFDDGSMDSVEFQRQQILLP